MSKIVTVSGPLPTATLSAAHAASHALLTQVHPAAPGLKRWMLGDDYVAIRGLSDELGIYVSILGENETRDELRAQATDVLRRLARRYRLDASCGGVELGSIDDTALRSPDAYGRGGHDEQAIAA